MKNQKAIALLMTLSILALVLVLVVGINEATNQEQQLQINQRDDRRIDNVSTIANKALISTILNFGANNLYYYTVNYETAAIPNFPLLADWPDITFGALSVKSIDHYFYINRVNYNVISETTDGQLQIFKNLIKQQGATGTVYSDNDINDFIGSLSDWIDVDDTVSTNNFLRGAEIYESATPSFSVKNTKLDSLTELNLLPSFQKLMLVQSNQSVFDLPFRILPLIDPVNQCDIGPVNLNMLSNNKEVAREFLINYVESVRGVVLDRCGYAELVQNSIRLNEQIANAVDKQVAPPFSLPLTTDILWDEIMTNVGSSQLKTKLYGLFSARSDLVEIRYSLSTNKYRSNYLLQLGLHYDRQSSDIPTNIDILFFTKIN